MEKHTYASDSQAIAMKAIREEIFQSFFAPVCVTNDGAKKMIHDLLGEDKALSLKALEQFNKALAAPFNVLTGTPNEIVQRAKAITNTVMPLMPSQIAVLQSMVDSKDLDMGWMQWIAQDAVTGKLAVTIVDILNLIEFEDVAAETSEPQMSDFLAATWQDIRPEWNKRGVRIARSILENDPMQSLNNIAVGLRFKAMAKMNRDMYLATQAGITAANSAGYTTSFSSTIAATINRARIAIYSRMSAKPGGAEFSMETPLVLVGNEIHRDIVEPIFDPLIAQISINYGTVRPMFPVNRVYSFKLASDLGISGNKMALILPFRHHRVAIFRPLEIASEIKTFTNSTNIWGQQAYNTLIEEEEIQVLSVS